MKWNEGDRARLHTCSWEDETFIYLLKTFIFLFYVCVFSFMGSHLWPRACFMPEEEEEEEEDYEWIAAAAHVGEG